MEPSAYPDFPTADTPAAKNGLAILIDFDACLLDIDAETGNASVAPAVRDTLSRLFQAFGGAVALITQRSLLEVDRMLGLPDIPVAASNGMEMRSLRKSAVAPATGRIVLSGIRRSDVITALMNAAPFAGRMPVYIGHTARDQGEPGIADRLGGFSVSVSDGVDRAQTGFSSPRDARALLSRWASASSAEVHSAAS